MRQTRRPTRVVASTGDGGYGAFTCAHESMLRGFFSHFNVQAGVAAAKGIAQAPQDGWVGAPPYRRCDAMRHTPILMIAGEVDRSRPSAS